eukprot:jgi/Mesvir1/14207/Mv09657-RA.1
MNTALQPSPPSAEAPAANKNVTTALQSPRTFKIHPQASYERHLSPRSPPPEGLARRATTSSLSSPAEGSAAAPSNGPSSRGAKASPRKFMRTKSDINPAPDPSPRAQQGNEVKVVMVRAKVVSPVGDLPNEADASSPLGREASRTKRSGSRTSRSSKSPSRNRGSQGNASPTSYRPATSSGLVIPTLDISAGQRRDSSPAWSPSEHDGDKPKSPRRRGRGRMGAGGGDGRTHSRKEIMNSVLGYLDQVDTRELGEGDWEPIHLLLKQTSKRVRELSDQVLALEEAASKKAADHAREVKNLMRAHDDTLKKLAALRQEHEAGIRERGRLSGLLRRQQEETSALQKRVDQQLVKIKNEELLVARKDQKIHEYNIREKTALGLLAKERAAHKYTKKLKEQAEARLAPVEDDKLFLEYRLLLMQQERTEVTSISKKLEEELLMEKESAQLFSQRLHAVAKERDFALKDSSQQHSMVKDLYEENMELLEQLHGETFVGAKSRHDQEIGGLRGELKELRAHADELEKELAHAQAQHAQACTELDEETKTRQSLQVQLRESEAREAEQAVIRQQLENEVEMLGSAFYSLQSRAVTLLSRHFAPMQQVSYAEKMRAALDLARLQREIAENNPQLGVVPLQQIYHEDVVASVPRK